MLDCPHCEHKFEPESPEELGIYNSKTGILRVSCPECKTNFRLNRKVSDTYLALFPALKKEMDQMKLDKDLNKDDHDEAPTNDFENKFRAALTIFGLNQKKYEPKIKAILDLTERTGASRDWLKYHLGRFSLTNKQNIDSIVDYVFIDEDAANILPPPPMQSSVNNPGFGMQQIRDNQGNVYLIPQGQQQQPGIQPIFIDRGSDRMDRVVRDSIDEGTIIEELDDEGKVKKRIIKGGSRQAVQPEKSEDQTMKVISLLKDIGIIPAAQTRQEPQQSVVPDEIRETLGQLKDAILVLGSSNRDQTSKTENEEIKQMSATVNKLTDQIQQYEKDKRDNETKMLRDELIQLKSMIANIDTRRGIDTPAAGLSDAQFGLHTQNKNLTTVTESVEHFGDRITAPMQEILRNQQKINSLLLVRDIEKQDGVAAGTYMNVLTPVVSPDKSEVTATVKRWQDKAASMPAGR